MVILKRSALLALATLSCMVGMREGFAAPDSSQSPGNDDPPPIVISDVVVTREEEGYTASYTMKNVSSKPVRGYILIVEAFDDREKPLGGRTLMAEKIPIPGRSEVIAPGASWTERSSLGFRWVNEVPVVMVSAKVLLDYVRFDDGSSWGPNKSRQSVGLGRMRQGVLFERSRLQKLLAEKGVQAVLDDLAHEIPPR
jgi:hypothetical protein